MIDLEVCYNRSIGSSTNRR